MSGGVGRAARCWVLRGQPALAPVVGGWGLCSLGRSSARLPVVGCRVAVRVVVENCTVDASIFCFCSVFVS